MMDYLADIKVKPPVLVAVVAGCFLAAKLGIALGSPFTTLGSSWPMMAIAIIFVLRFGTYIWPEIWLGCFLGIATQPFGSLSTIALGAAIATAAVLQAVFLTKIVRPIAFKAPFESAQGIFIYLGFAIFMALGYGILAFFIARIQGAPIPWAHFIHDRAIDDLLAILLATPFFLPFPSLKSLPRIIEGSLLICSIVLVNSSFFAIPQLAPLREPLMCPLFLWAILRFGYLGITGIGTLASGAAIWAISQGYHLLPSQPMTDQLFFFQIRLTALLAIGLILVAILEDRHNALQALHKSHQEMENRIKERTAELERFKFIIDHAAEEFFLARMDGSLAYVNETGARNLGYTQEEMVRLSLPDIAPNFTMARHLAAKQEVPPPFETIFKLKDGEIIPVEIRLAHLNLQGEDYICGFAHNITKRKQTQMVIQRERDLAQQYLDIMAVLLVVVNPQGEIQLINKRGCQILGYPEKALLGKKWIEHCIPEESRHEIEELFHKLLNGETVENHCNVVVTHSGEKRLIGFRNSLLQENGQITGIIFSGEDVTECQMAKEALTESERKFRMLAEASPTGIIILQGEELRYINPSTTKLTGYSQAELSQEQFLNMLHPEDRPQILGMIERYHGGEEPLHLCELRLIRKDGATRWFGLRANHIYFEGAPALLCSIADFTNEIEALVKLRISEDKYRRLFNAVNDAIFIVDANDFSLIDCNSRANELYGYSLEEHQNRGPSSFPILAQDATAKLQLAREKELPAFEWPAQRKSGEIFWTEVSMQPLKIGKDNRIIVIARDISERKRAEAWSKEQEKIEAIKESERLKDQFLSIVSHELRTPLNAVMGFGSLLEDGVFGGLNTQQTDAVSKILDGANRMLNLVNDLLDLAKLQAGELDFHFEEVDYPELVNEAISFLQPLADEKNIQIYSDIQVPECVSIDGERVFQLLSNLVSNAIKFSNPGNKVQIIAHQDQDSFVTEVIDNGFGIAEEDLPKLFERFKQLDMSLTRKIGGSGLGLSIAKGIVEGHRGHIKAISPGIGHGSTFRFRIPVKA